MSPIAILITIYCVAVVFASLCGGWIPSWFRLTHSRMQFTMSAVSGLMLGVALLHMLPHSTAYLHSTEWVAGLMLAGILVMFFLLRVFHVHEHGELEEDHDEHCQHDHHQVSWVGLFVGLAIHTLLDGVALGASVVAEAAHAGTLSLAGLGTFLAVLLHKPLDALAITSLMKAEKWSARNQAIANCGFALMCPLGAILFCLGASQIAGHQAAIVGVALAFSAGFFLCIALSDLLPEVAFHRHDRIKLSLALLLGVAVAIGVELLPGHSHTVDGAHDHSGHSHEHDH